MIWGEVSRQDKLLIIDELYSKMRKELLLSKRKEGSLQQRHLELYRAYAAAADKLFEGLRE